MELRRAVATQDVSAESVDGAAAATTGADVTVVTVRVKHKVDGLEVYIQVPAGATMGDIRRILAGQQQDQSIWSKGRIVKPFHGQLVPYTDEELLGNKRRLLFIGAKLKQIPSDLQDRLRTRSDGNSSMAKEAKEGERDGIATTKPPSARPKLSKARAMALQVELRAKFSDESFQKHLRQLESKWGPGTREFVLGRRELMAAVHKEVLPRYGLEVSVEGVLDMIEQVSQMGKTDEAIANEGRAIMELLKDGNADISVQVQPASKAPGQPPQLHADAKAAPAVRAAAAATPKALAGPLLPSSQIAPASSVSVGSKAQERTIRLGLQHSSLKYDIVIDSGATVGDLKAKLEEEYGVPRKVRVLGRTKEGSWRVLEDDSKPMRRNVLEGVMTLEHRASVGDFLENDMLDILDKLHRSYEGKLFQDLSAQMKQPPYKDIAAVMATRDSVRIAINAIEQEAVSAWSKDGSEEELVRFRRAVEGFKRFPSVAEGARKVRILIGTIEPEQARRMQQEEAGRREAALQQRKSVRHDERSGFTIREIISERALLKERAAADEVFDLLYQRIYEENREGLWAGGRVKGHEMPTREAVARKYLSHPGTFLLHCATLEGSRRRRIVGGASVFPVVVQALKMQADLGETADIFSRAESRTEEDEEDQDAPLDDNSDDDDDERKRIAVGYIDGLAAIAGSHAGSVLLADLVGVANDEAWDMLALHSVAVPHTLRFWEKKGFHAFGPGADGDFRLACLQNLGHMVSKQDLELLLPPHPGCVLYAKFVDRS